jgi:hypothetical protein
LTTDRSLVAVGDREIDAELSRRVRAATEADIPPPPPPLPAPEIPWRAPTDFELASCNSAKSLLKKVGALGWHVQAHFARGPFIGADGQSLGMADAIILIFRWTTVEAFATWYWREGKLTDKGKPAWEFGSAYYVRPHQRLSSPELSYWLTGEGPKPKKVTEAAA